MSNEIQKDINTLDQYGKNTKLLDAAAIGTLEDVKRLITQGAQVNAKTENGYTSLLIAAGRGRTEIVQILLDAGANIFIRGKSGGSAIQLAGDRGYAETAALLIKVEKEKLIANIKDFIDNKDGTINDKDMGLVWQQTDDGIDRTYKEAMAYCESLELGGHHDWRPPFWGELQRLASIGHENLSPLFPKVKPGWYWTFTWDTLNGGAVSFNPDHKYGAYSSWDLYTKRKFFILAVRE